MTLFEISEDFRDPRHHIIDAWSFLDYKPNFAYGLRSRTSQRTLAPTWIGDHFRRLMAYKLLEDFCRNSARYWLNENDPEVIDTRREYGDPNVIVEQFLSSLLGDDQSIIVPDAIGTTPTNAGSQKLLQSLLDWADKEQLDVKVVECERNAIKLGDGVYVLGWNEELQRPRLQVWDPGFFFPVWDDSRPEQEFPNKVHIAYEFEADLDLDVAKDKEKYVRRITWELVPLSSDGTPAGDPGTQALPWDDSAKVTCILTDATWRIDDLKNTIDDLTWPNAWRIDHDHEDLKIDFIPVIHITNTIAGAEHFGTSSLAPVMQLLEDIVSTDTDTQAASATTGSPPIVLSGVGAPTDSSGRLQSYGPGTVLQSGDGSATILDTSHSLDALMKLSDSLLSRLSVNGRIPEALLGRVKPSEVPSGIALTLSFTPHSGAIKQMRMVRRRKYSLLLKFVARFMSLKTSAATVTSEIQYHFGSFLPADKQETQTLVVQLLSTKPPAISLETAIRMLMEAGYPIEDAAAEIKLIHNNDFESAQALADATGDQDAVRRRLGLGGPPPIPPAINPLGPPNPTPGPAAAPPRPPTPPGGTPSPPQLPPSPAA